MFIPLNMENQRDLIEEMHIQRKSKAIFEKAKEISYEYLDKIPQRCIFPDKESLINLQIFDEELQNESIDPIKLLEILHQYGSPNTVIQTGGRYFGYVNGGGLPIALAARWIGDTWNQNVALYNMSPIASKLEDVCEKWLIDLFGLQKNSAIGFVSGTTSATQTGLIIARDSLLQRQDWNIKKNGLNGSPEIKIVLSDQAHSSVFKILTTIGFGERNIRRVPSDEQGRIIVSEVGDIDSSTILIIQAGNVNTGAFDPIDELCDIANKNQAWVHIDGAFGLWAATSEKTSYLTRGIEKANSLSTDAHKTLNIPYDSGIIICRHRDLFLKAMHAHGDYILYSNHRDGMNYTPEMSRRARIVEFWAALKYLGKNGVAALIDHLCHTAHIMSEELHKIGFQILNDVVFNQILVFYENSEKTETLIKILQQSGEIWLGGSKWKQKSVIRISICSWAITNKDIIQTINAMQKAIVLLKKNINSA